MKNAKDRYIEQLYKGEMLHKDVYERLAEREKDKTLRSLLKRLSNIEGRHVRIWGGLIDTKAAASEPFRVRFMTAFMSSVRSFLGLALTVKIIEYGESELKAKLNNALAMQVNRKQRNAVLKLERSMDSVEDPLQQQIVEYSPVLRNIRDVIFGMNDGLVEVLAAVAGFGAALQQPTLVLLAGFIVAVSGTLSMAGGAYLSTEYERSIKIDESKGRSSARLSAAYVGLFYIVGAAFPLLPFALGFGGYYGIIGSIIVTAIVLTIVSSLISVVSDTSIAKRVVRTLAISLGIAAVTIIIGVIARQVLHLVV